jgi:hypothetical protein
MSKGQWGCRGQDLNGQRAVGVPPDFMDFFWPCGRGQKTMQFIKIAANQISRVIVQWKLASKWWFGAHGKFRRGKIGQWCTWVGGGYQFYPFTCSLHWKFTWYVASEKFTVHAAWANLAEVAFFRGKQCFSVERTLLRSLCCVYVGMRRPLRRCQVIRVLTLVFFLPPPFYARFTGFLIMPLFLFNFLLFSQTLF